MIQFFAPCFDTRLVVGGREKGAKVLRKREKPKTLLFIRKLRALKVVGLYQQLPWSDTKSTLAGKPETDLLGTECSFS